MSSHLRRMQLSVDADQRLFGKLVSAVYGDQPPRSKTSPDLRPSKQPQSSNQRLKALSRCYAQQYLRAAEKKRILREQNASHCHGGELPCSSLAFAAGAATDHIADEGMFGRHALGYGRLAGLGSREYLPRQKSRLKHGRLIMFVLPFVISFPCTCFLVLRVCWEPTSCAAMVLSPLVYHYMHTTE